MARNGNRPGEGAAHSVGEFPENATENITASSIATIAARTSSPPLNEGQIMSAIAKHFAWRGRRGIWWAHILNGGLRSKIEANILRGQGVKPGAPDLLIVADGKALFLEVKTKAGRVSQAQADCHEKLRRAGAEVGVCYGIDEALRQLEQWQLLRGQTPSTDDTGRVANNDTSARNSALIIPLSRPRIEPALDCDGFYVIRDDHGWLFGDRRQALHEFDEVERIERWGSA